MRRDKTELPGRGIAYSYARFSSSKQADGSSEDRQDEMRDGYLRDKGLTLDTSFDLRDLGKSGFHGVNKSRGDLGVFLTAIKAGKTKPGATFIVENLDRLTREEPFEVLDTLKTIIHDGRLILASLKPFYEISYDSLIENPGQWYMLMGDCLRAHGEGKRKQDLSRKNWDMKYDRAKDGGFVLTRRCPPWLKPTGSMTFHGKEYATGFEPIPSAVKTIRFIVKKATEGWGTPKLLKHLNGSNVPIITSLNGKKLKSHCWNRAYIGILLNDRRLIGELERSDWDGANKRNVPTGEVYPNYYPAIISDNEFHAMRQAVEGRKWTGRGREATTLSNLFKGIVYDARDGKIMHKISKGRKSADGGHLVSSGAKRGMPGSEYVTINYLAVETAILKWLSEFNPNGLQTRSSTADLLEQKRGELAGLAAKAEAAENQAMDDADFTLLKNVLKKLDARKKAVEKDVAALQQKLASEGHNHYRDSLDFIEKLAKLKGDQKDEMRTRLRGSLSQVIDQVWILVNRVGRFTRSAMIQVHLKSGLYRSFVLHCRRGKPDVVSLPQMNLLFDGLTQDVDLREYRKDKSKRRASKVS